MDNKIFKKLINEMAYLNNFKVISNVWFKESKECIFIMYLQKSNYGNYYYLNIKIYVQGSFNKSYTISKDIAELKRDIGDFFIGPPKESEIIFHLDRPMDDNERKQRLGILFSDFITPIADKALTLNGIKGLIQDGRLNLRSSTKEELNKLGLDV